MARITIEDVASQSGVSMTTVSHVFSGHRPVSVETQRLVKEVADRLGYRPNAVARSLRSQRTQTIMIVVPDITNSFYPEYARSLQDVVAAAGYHSLLCNTDAREAEELAFLEEAISRRLEGVAFTGFRLPVERLIPLADEGIAVVNVGAAAEGSLVDSVRFDDRGAVAEATRFLLERYGMRVGMIYGDKDAPVGRDRLDGFESACREFGIDPAQTAIVLEEFTRAGGAAGMRRLLDRVDRPRAVVCANDMIALGAIDALKERGLDVPGDVAVLGYDDVDAATIVTPKLTTVHADATRLGAEVGAMLVSRMSGEYTGPGRHLVLDHELVVRESA